MGAARLQRPRRHQQPGRRGKDLGGPGRSHLLQPQRTRHLNTPFPWWVVTLAGAAVASGEWLRAPSRLAALAALALLLLTLALKRRGWIALPLLATAAAIGTAEWRIERLERQWPVEREARIEAASGRLANELRAARALADSLARRGVAVAELPQEAAFHVADRLVGNDGIEAGVVAFDSGGAPRVWGGRFRLLPASTGDSVSVRLTAYYAVLEVRRHAPSGRVGLGAVLLAADSAVPDQDRSLAARFHERTEVGLRIVPPRAAPNSSDVFDYEEPTTGGTRVLFSVQFVPPDRAEAIARARSQGARRVAWALVATLLAAVLLVPAGLGRLALGLLPFGLALRAPLGVLLGVPQPFDPGLFTSRLLGPVSSSAGPLAVSGVVLILLGALLWERAPARKPLGVLGAMVLLVMAPYVMAELGRGILPPASGVSMGLWLVWQLTLFLATGGLLIFAAALLRGRGAPGGSALMPLLGAALALLVAWIGVEVWNARFGWPDWYTLLWLPVLVLVTRPAGRRATIVGIAITAGSAAALLTWGAEIEGRLAAARADLAALGDAAPPRDPALLRGFGDRILAAPAPRTAPELYALWRGSTLSKERRPVTLGVWHPDGTPVVLLELDRIDLPSDLVSAAVRGLSAADSIAVQAFNREPAVHDLLLVRRDSATVVAVALGPRSALIPPTRLGRLLDVHPPHLPLYRLTLAPSPSAAAEGPGVALWHREGWQALGGRTVTIAGVPRDVHGTVELGSRETIAVRGALVLILDTAVFAALWLLTALLGGWAPSRPAWMPHLRSFEARLGAALAVFFLAPTLGFAAWGMGRLRTEVRDSRDRMIEQSLRDVVPASGSLPAGEAELEGELRVLGQRMDADFTLYRDGEYVAGSTGGLLEALGVVGPLMAPPAYHRILIHGDDVASADGPSQAVATRVGYRAVKLSDRGAGVLAMPRVAVDPMLSDNRRDLALVLLLATIAGIAASLLGARAAAGALARPVSELRDAAISFGRGEPVPSPARQPPPEFAPVFAAFERMTEDVRRAREAQERVARIVAWGEMANQVAHEIKNPLTPMRLGVQHLRRVYQDARTPIGPVLEDTTGRILSEIDRLDRIARSFSRFGVPASERGPLETVNLPPVARDVADLYRLGPESAEIVVSAAGAIPVSARTDEVKEALVNLLENSRNARARTIAIRIVGTTVSVEDDGCGIPAALLPMIFEPRFSTSTSGSGLGLPIVKRLVEGWGGRVEVESAEGRGTVVRLHLLTAGGDGPPPAQVGS